MSTRLLTAVKWAIRSAIAPAAVSCLLAGACALVAGPVLAQSAPGLTLTDSLTVPKEGIARRAATPAPTPTSGVSSPASSPASKIPAVTPEPLPAGVVPLVTLGIGDPVTVQVYGQPDLGATATVSDDGTILIPLVGPIQVAGLSPFQAQSRIAAAFLSGEYLVNPQVTVTLNQLRSQQVSVLGEVHSPGRYPVESRTTIFDLLAVAGGRTADGAPVIFLLRTDATGGTTRTPINIDSLFDSATTMPSLRLEGGDTLFVPKAAQYFIIGEVANPNQYRLEPGTTVIQAISRAGGVTRRGSTSRVEIKRRKADGSYVTLHPSSNDAIESNDVIRVKESIF